MAKHPHSSITFLIIVLLNVVFSTSIASGREIPVGDAKNLDGKKLHPESFIGHDGSVLVPGVGRWMFPKPGTHFNPITYNPVTGTNGGNGVSIPGLGGGSSTGIGYVPGGDDTFVPNPGFEVPSAGGSVPVPSTP
ncbi:OLC1v1024056C1 [Oldenlandia corymbosa var. corymbosa]|uniref:OLC1v1024056C1 n=1 Tax=Oldenlandia corymbosa var. corymbosa TaxID=529605 RepID=A0AAV1C4F1_OLDCO|nr:OLC1v1024056C1 [Oldenlandia corymbosa var. corymbosa]